MTDHKHLLLAAAIFTLLLGGCSKPAVKTGSHEMLNAVLWTKTSAEYTGNALQAYHAARMNLDLALADPQWTAALEQTGDYGDLPPAIIVDLDQTVLDNSTYNAEMVRNNLRHTEERHVNWCRNTTAKAIPGVRGFLDYAVKRGVTVIYNSARTETMRDCTTRNLQQLGLPLPDQGRLLLSGGTAVTTKQRHRERVGRKYRILLLIGDDLNDFVAGSETDVTARQALASRYADYWGRQWIILPNPMYGHWEGALYGYDEALPAAGREQLKLRYLQE